MSQVVAVDIGGTHARFAIANRTTDGRIELEDLLVLRTAEYADLKSAWAHFQSRATSRLPEHAAISIACPTENPILKLTNSHWTITKATLARELGLERLLILNDFLAVGYAILNAQPSELAHLCGPESPLPTTGVISIVGPGTGLGVAHILQTPEAASVIATEGGHIGFAPQDEIDDAILARLRLRHGRVSVERVVSGAGLVDIYVVKAKQSGISPAAITDKELWALALDGTDALATAALERFCLCLGAVAGDIALAHGAAGVVIAGGLGLKLASHLKGSSFRKGLMDKGRFSERLASIPVKMITTPQPGLVGAVYAFTAN